MSPRPRKRRSNQNRPGRHGRRRQGAGAAPRQGGVEFWGDPSKLPSPRQDVRITADAAAVARSLGPPPLPGHEAIAGHYFAAVYDRAVTLAGALAAAGGMITPEELLEPGARSDPSS